VRRTHFGCAVASVVVSLLGCQRPAAVHESSDDAGLDEIRAQIRPEARSSFDTILLLSERPKPASCGRLKTGQS
jgi:hypothetical protein